jgi:hypothetical protein
MSPRALRLALAAALAALAFALARSPADAAAGSTLPEVVRARAIELLDGEGRERASLKVEEGGEVVLRLRSASGAIRVKLGAGEDGSALLLLDHRTEPGLHLVAQRSSTRLTLAREGREPRTVEP